MIHLSVSYAWKIFWKILLVFWRGIVLSLEKKVKMLKMFEMYP